MKSWWLAAGSFMASMTIVAMAQADALPPPPACPPGSQGTTSHAGPRCVPAPCDSDEDCKEVGGSCRDWRVCTRSTKVGPHRRRRGAPPTYHEIVVGTCPPADKCKGDEEPPPPTVGKLIDVPPSCSERKFCVPASLPPLPAPTASAKRGPGGKRSRLGACGCRLGSKSGADSSGWLSAFGLLALVLRRKP